MPELENQTKQFLTYCQYQRKLSQSTLRSYGFDLQLFSKYLTSLDPPITQCDQVDRHVLQGYTAHLSSQHAVKTVKRKIACIRSFYNYLEEEGIFEENPFYRYKLRIKEGFRLPNVMTLQELSKVLEAAYQNVPIEAIRKAYGRKKPLPLASEEFLALRDFTILEILFAGGLRVSELCSLRFEDVSMLRSSPVSNTAAKTVAGTYDLPENIRLMVHGKGNKERTIYLEDSEVKKALTVYLELRRRVAKEVSTLFLSKFAAPLSTQAVRNLVTKYASMAGLERTITPHVFRHTFASLLHEEGVDIKFIQDFLGHSSISTTQIYVHTSSAKKRQILSTMHPRKKLEIHGSGGA